MCFPQHKLVHKTYLDIAIYLQTNFLVYRWRSFTMPMAPLRYQLNSILEAYTTDTRAYIHFCSQIGHPPFPSHHFPLQPHIIQDYGSLFRIQYASVRWIMYINRYMTPLYFTGIRILQDDQFKRHVHAPVTI